MGIALYALFVALLLPSCKKSTEAIVYATLAGVFNTLLGQFEWLSSSGGFAISVISIAMVAAYIKQKKGRAQYE